MAHCECKLEENPKRPPKEWWNRCVAGVEESGSAADPQSVCGALWYHKMRASDKRTITRMAEKKMNENPGFHEGDVVTYKDVNLRDRTGIVQNAEGKWAWVLWRGQQKPTKEWSSNLRKDHALAANPMGMGMGLLLAAGAAGVLWLLTRKKEAVAAPVLSPPPSYVTTTCTINEKVLDAWGKAMGVGILVGYPEGTAAPIGATVLPLLAWNPGETFLRGLNNIQTPDAMATKSYCDWATKAPGAPPAEPTQPPAPTSAWNPMSNTATASSTVQGPESVYVLKRLFVWTGTAWALENQEENNIAGGQADWLYQSQFSWPMFAELQNPPAPYYYADAWSWTPSGGYKKATCSSNYKLAGCD
jgi:hypothetical protein